jgi:integrase
MDDLTDLERELLAFAGLQWRHAGARDSAIRERFAMTPTRYHQLLTQLIDSPAALAAEPVLVKRLQRMRARRVRRAAWTMAHRHGKAWRGSVQMPGRLGPLRQGGFSTKAAAERWERDTAVDLARGSYRDPHAGAVLFGDWADRWLATCGTLKRSSSVAEKAIVETHLRPAFDRMRLDEIGPTAVRTLVSQLNARRAPKTVRNVHAVLFNVLSLAVEEGLLEGNPCTGTRLPKNRRKKPRAFLTEQEVERLVAATDEHYRPLVVVLATTGLRWGEAVGLRVGRVDLLARELRVEETANEAAGVLTYGPPKSEASVRTVTLPARAVDALLPLVAGRDRKDLVFVTRQGLPVRHRNFYYRQWRRAVAAAGLVERQPTPHDLRHTHAAVLIARGVPLSAVKERLGHESINTTDGLYGFLLPQVDRGVLAALDEAFGDPLTDTAVPQASHDLADESGKGL